MGEDPIDILGLRRWDPMPWRDEAACRGAGVDVFFSPDNEQPHLRRLREHEARRQYCSRCTVAAECGDYAMHNREHGLWGGLTEEDRARAGAPPRYRAPDSNDSCAGTVYELR